MKKWQYEQINRELPKWWKVKSIDNWMSYHSKWLLSCMLTAAAWYVIRNLIK